MQPEPAPTGDSKRTILLVAGIVIVACCCALALLLVLLGPAIGQIFSRAGS